MPNPVIDLSGETFARLSVVRRAPATGGEAQWVCRCECGQEMTVRGSVLRTGRRTSCGCARSATARARSVTHGTPDNTRHGHGRSRSGKRTTTYVVWTNMLQRTTNPKSPAWKWYGKRGITVCDRWRDFANFLADMGERPEGLSLDRIDNDGNYEPGNCRWATSREQRLNQRNTRRMVPA